MREQVAVNCWVLIVTLMLSGAAGIKQKAHPGCCSFGGWEVSPSKTTLVFAPRNVGVSEFENVEEAQEEIEEIEEDYEA